MNGFQTVPKPWELVERVRGELRAPPSIIAQLSALTCWVPSILSEKAFYSPFKKESQNLLSPKGFWIL